MEIFLVLIVVGVLWFISKLIYGTKSNVLSSSKYRADLIKQEKELEEGRSNNNNWWKSGTPQPSRKPVEPEIKKVKEVEDIQKIRLKMEDLIGGIFNGRNCSSLFNCVFNFS